MKRTQLFASLLAAAAAVATVLMCANADLARLTDGPPVLKIHSTGGTITVTQGDFPGVRVPGNPAGVHISRFLVSRQALGRVVLPRQIGGRNTAGGPRGFALPMRNFNVPGIRDGAHGVALDNAGGDMNVEVPNRVEAMYIDAGPSPVVLDRVSGPFIVVSDAGDVTLRNVTGHGFVRTINGNIDVRGTGGNVHIETAFGRVTMQSAGGLDHGDIIDLHGDVDWTFNGVGQGAYRIFSGDGVVRVLLRPNIGATVDAQSDTGSVTNLFDPGAADVRFARPHALSIAVGGGGAQITVHSRGGTVVVAPAP
jgi:hypothetical protein